jgi:hypothetical protein
MIEVALEWAKPRLSQQPHATTQAPKRADFLNVGGAVTRCSASWQGSRVTGSAGSWPKSMR